MKVNQEDIHNEINKTLSSIDDLKKAAPKPFFYGRLTNRLKEKGKDKWAFDWTANLRVSAIVVVLLLVINCFVALNYESQETYSQDDYGAFLSDYNIEASSIYDINE